MDSASRKPNRFLTSSSRSPATLFNRAHACCYGLIANQTAYLKANYPVEYMTAILCSAMGNTEKVANAIAECRRLGLKGAAAQPQRQRYAQFSVGVEGDERFIRYGLAAIKNVGQGAVQPIIDERRRNGPFRSVDDFCQRDHVGGLNRRTVESLIKAGAFDCLGKRSQILAVLDPDDPERRRSPSRWPASARAAYSTSCRTPPSSTPCCCQTCPKFP